MLSDDEKKDLADKIKKLEKDQSGMRASFKKKEDKKNAAGQFQALGLVYEFISTILVMSLAGYFIAKYTDTQPWTMIAFIILGFVYAYYRLYKSVS